MTTVNQRHKDGALIQQDLYPYKRRKRHQIAIFLRVRAQREDHMKTQVEDSWLSASQGEKPREKAILPTP